MYHKNKGPCSNEVTRPWQNQQNNSYKMMNQHFPKIFPLYVFKHWEEQRPVETELNHVVPPNIVGHTLQKYEIDF